MDQYGTDRTEASPEEQLGLAPESMLDPPGDRETPFGSAELVSNEEPVADELVSNEEPVADEPVSDEEPVPDYPDPPRTGDPAVDEVIEAVARSVGGPLEEQLAVYDTAHRTLQDRLADVEG